MAINLGSVWSYLNLVVRKEISGNRLTPTQFTDLCKISSLEFFNTMAERYEVHQRDTESMKRHKASTTLSLDNSGQASYPTGYFRVTSLRTMANWPIDIVTDAELAERFYDSLRIPSSAYPVAQLMASKVQVYPNIGTANMIYLTYPSDPNFDYVVDNLTDEKVYMPVGSYIESGGDLHALGGALIQANCTHPTATSFPYTSTSVEFDWNDEDILRIIAIMLQKLGINMADGGVVQYFATKEQMDKVQ